MKLFECTECHTGIKLSFIKGYVHITCPTCGKRYQLDQSSIRKYMLIPLLCVAFAVKTSLMLLNEKTIDVKFIYIIGVSFLMSGFVGYLAIRCGFLRYEEKEDR